jgi:y4mF family transcriptional regulator
MKDDLKKIVREHRRLSGLSQSQLAKIAGVGKTVIFDIEHGKESVQFDTLKKVLDALNIKFILQSPVLERLQRQQAEPNTPSA